MTVTLDTRPGMNCTGAYEPAVRSGLNFDIARTAQDVVEAWGLVYQAYLRKGLIDSNPHQIHTMARAVNPRTCVMLARLGEVAGGTLSAILDGSEGLPLDEVYHDELQALRGDGHRLMEMGLFADRREDISRSFAAVVELMRLAVYYGSYGDATTAVVGVHPRHAPFYVRYFAFETAGEVKQYATVRDNPVVLLKMHWYSTVPTEASRKGLSYLLNNPLPLSLFEERFAFTPGALAGTLLEQYMRADGATLA